VLEKFENASLILRLSLQSTLICHDNGREHFENALQTGEIWKRRVFVFVWTENILKTKLFENDDIRTIMWFPSQSFPQVQLRSLHFKLLRRSVDGKHLTRFQSENVVFIFLPRSVDGALALRDSWNFRSRLFLLGLNTRTRLQKRNPNNLKA